MEASGSGGGAASSACKLGSDGSTFQRLRHRLSAQQHDQSNSSTQKDAAAHTRTDTHLRSILQGWLKLAIGVAARARQRQRLVQPQQPCLCQQASGDIRLGAALEQLQRVARPLGSGLVQLR